MIDLIASYVRTMLARKSKIKRRWERDRNKLRECGTMNGSIQPVMKIRDLRTLRIALLFKPDWEIENAAMSLEVVRHTKIKDPTVLQLSFPTRSLATPCHEQGEHPRV